MTLQPVQDGRGATSGPKCHDCGYSAALCFYTIGGVIDDYVEGGRR